MSHRRGYELSCFIDNSVSFKGILTILLSMVQHSLQLCAFIFFLAMTILVLAKRKGDTNHVLVGAFSIEVLFVLRISIKVQDRMRPSLVQRLCFAYSTATFMLVYILKVKDRMRSSLMLGLCFAYLTVTFRSIWSLLESCPVLTSAGSN